MSGDLHVGKVVRFTNAGRPVVSVPTLARGYELDTVEILATAAVLGAVTEAAGDPGHTHTIDATVIVGDRVLVGAIAGIPDHVVLFGRLV